MEQYRVLFNPNARNGQGLEVAKQLEGLLSAAQVRFSDMTAIGSYAAFLGELPAEERLVVAGGDGTLNRFVNDMAGLELTRDIYYFGAGSGNDFMRDVGRTREDGPFLLNDYIRRLPEVEVNGRRYKFINGVGVGLDGHACEQVSRQKQERGKNASYAVEAVKGLLGAYHPTKAVVTVDGARQAYDHVWLAPTMLGRYLGGGIKLAPDQDRRDPLGQVSAMVLATPSRLRALRVFPTVFSGGHTAFTDLVTVIKGHRICVEFDQPVAMQVDGEHIPQVRAYTVRSGGAIAADTAG